MSIRNVVDQVWAEDYGLSAHELRAPGTRVVKQSRKLVVRRIDLLRLGDGCTISVPSDLFARVAAAVQDVAPDDVFTCAVAHDLIDDEIEVVVGPLWHGFLDVATFAPSPACDARRLTPADLPIMEALRETVPVNEWEDGGRFIPQPEVVWGCFEQGKLVALGNMTDFAGRPADVGLLTRPDVRGRGVATRLASRMIEDALRSAPVIRYRAVETNEASLRIARRLGFEQDGAVISVRLRS